MMGLRGKLIWLSSGLVLAVGCGGNEAQPSMMGSSMGMGMNSGVGMGTDPMLASGSLGTGPARGSLTKKQPDLGVDANLNGFKIFEDGSIWNKNVEKDAVDPNSSKFIAKIGADKPLLVSFGASGPNKLPFGIPYLVVSADAPKIAVNFADEKGSSPAAYPFPLQMPIESGGHGHAIVIDRDTQRLYEVMGAKPNGATYDATSGAVWDLRAYQPRKPNQESADPSGLPVFPGLLRFDEVSDIKGVNHPLRVTLSAVSKLAVLPATRSNGTSSDPELPPMGTHFRLKKSFKISGFSPNDQAILAALKKYGMIVSDTGPDLALSGTPDIHWMDEDLANLKKVKASDFEVLKPPAAKKSKKEDEVQAAVSRSSSASSPPSSKSTANPAGVSDDDLFND